MQRPGDGVLKPSAPHRGDELGLRPAGGLQELRVVSLWWGRDLVCLTPVSPGPALRVARSGNVWEICRGHMAGQGWSEGLGQR